MSKEAQLDRDMSPFLAWSQDGFAGWHGAVERLADRVTDRLGEREWSLISQGLEDARRAGKIDEQLERAFHHLY